MVAFDLDPARPRGRLARSCHTARSALPAGWKALRAAVSAFSNSPRAMASAKRRACRRSCHHPNPVHATKTMVPTNPSRRKSIPRIRMRAEVQVLPGPQTASDQRKRRSCSVWGRSGGLCAGWMGIQVLAGLSAPPVTSGNVGRVCIRSPLGRPCTGGRPQTCLPCLVMESGRPRLPSSLGSGLAGSWCRGRAGSA
jgi:hypothetical protein